MNKKIISTLLIISAITSSLFAFTTQNVEMSKLENQVTKLIYQDSYSTTNLLFGAETSPLDTTPDDQIDFVYGGEFASFRYFGSSSYGMVSRLSVLINDNEYASFNYAQGMNLRYNLTDKIDYNIGITPLVNYYMSIDQTVSNPINLLYLGGEMSANLRWYPSTDKPELSFNTGFKTSYARRIPYADSSAGKDFRCQIQGFVGMTYTFYGSKLVDSDIYGVKAMNK